jgi:hypothetical protein
MLQYLKERFKEYMSLESWFKEKDVVVPIKDQGTDKDLYVDYDIYYGGTSILIESFSMSKEEMEQNLSKALILNIADTLKVSIFNIKLISADLNTILCDVSYSGKQEEYIRHELKKVIKPVYEFDPDDYEDSDDYEMPDMADYDPYAKTPWGDGWHCMCCGFATKRIPKGSKHWAVGVSAMRINGTQWYLCSNKECFHHNSPLVLHHPYSTHAPAGDSYSLSRLQ